MPDATVSLYGLPPSPTPSLPGPKDRGLARSHVPRILRLVSVLTLGIVLLLTSSMGTQAASVITHGSRDRHWVALTFDDGWSTARCARIARTLRAKHATATFLINGMIVAGAPARWRTILKGFPVANHTHGHAWLSKVSATVIRRQITKNESVFERILRRPMLHLLRPPYGAYDREVLSVAGALGYQVILWDTSSADTSPAATTSTVFRNATRGGNGSIVLMHCGPAATPAAVGPIIDSYRRRGFRLVGLDEMFESAAPPTACRVKNRDKGTTSTSLRAAVRAASPGDHLTLRGTCRGRSSVGKALRIKGVEFERSGTPSLVGQGEGPVVVVRNDVALTLIGVTVRGGKADQGGGILNRGALSLRDVVVRDNKAASAGGGVCNLGTLALSGGSAIRRNVAPNGAGVENAGSLQMDATSAITANRAATTGGGVYGTGPREGVRCTPRDQGGNVYANSPDDCDPPGDTVSQRRRSRR